MAFFFNNPQRPILSQVVEALQQLQNDPQQLSHERDRRYNEPPPPYSESGETTQPPTPGPPVVDESYQRELRKIARYKSTPYNQFKSQAERERERLEHQISHERFGRRQTLPWDDSLDLQANPENNVRSRWVEQGIWGDEWGPAWPKDSHPLTTKWEHRGGGPFFGPHSVSMSDSWPGGRWGHEEYSPELEFETKSESEPEQESRRTLSVFSFGARQPEPRKPRRRPIPTEPGPVPQYLIPRPTVRNAEASQPYHQFLYQISKEREWIKDELDYKAPGTAVDLDAMAYQSVKDNWIQDQIWNPKWGELPGMTWIYEEPEEEEVVEAPAANGATVEQPQDAVDDSRQETRSPRSANIFAPTPIPDAANGRPDGSSAPTPGNAEASVTERRTNEMMGEAPSGQPAVTPSVQGTQHTPRRSPRIARKPRAEEVALPPPRQSKRSRGSDAVEDAQPPKRLRRNRQDSALLRNASDAANVNKPQDSRTVVTKGTTKVKTLPGDEKAVPTSRKKGGERIKAVSSPPRRSARIAEREKKRKADAAEKLLSGPPRTKTTKKASCK